MFSNPKVILGTIILCALAVVVPANAELRAYYKFDDLSMLGRDSSGYGNNAVLGSTNSYTTGYFNSGFLGTGQTYLQLPSIYTTSVNTFTATAWIKKTTAATATYEYIVYDRTYRIGLVYQKANPPKNYLNQINYLWGLIPGDANIPGNFNSGLEIPMNEWVFVAVVVQPTQATVFLCRNDILYYSVNTYNHITQPFTDPFIAAKYPYDATHKSSFFGGVIDEVRIYNHALTNSEIQSLAKNTAPTVEAGQNKATASGTIQLSGSVSDDGKPNPPGAVTQTWSKVSGPGTVTFNPSATVLSPTATFSALGVYELKLTASDGQFSSSDTVTITYKENDAPSVQAPDDRYISSDVTDLSCIVQDDGLPNPPAEVSLMWSKVSGPGVVTFTPSADVPNPTAHFSAEGIYMLQLTADDGEYQASDTMVVDCHVLFINPDLIKVSSSADYGDFANPDVNKIKDGSGIGGDGLHNNSFYDMCYIWDTTTSSPKYDNEITATGKVWFAFEFNRAYTIDKVWLWNYNNVPAYGMKDITIAYSLDKDNWNQYSCQLAQANGTSESAQVADVPDASAKYVVIMANTNYQSGTQNKFGLSEVKFNCTGSGSTKAISPDPANNSTNPALDAVLSWVGASASDVVSHKVYFSTSSTAVSNRTCAYVNTVKESYTPSNLVAGTKYYWAVDEVDSGGNVVSGGAGDLWNFTVGAMEIRNVGVNGTLLGKIPVEKIQIVSNGTVRGEVQVDRNSKGELYAVITGADFLFKSWDGGRTWSSKSLSSLLTDPNDGNPAFAIQKDDSFVTIHVPYAAFDPNYTPYYRVDHKLYVQVNRSTNYGTTWSPLTKIYSSPYDTMVEGALTLTRTYDGRLLYSVRRWTWDWDYASHGLPNYWYDRYSAQAIAEGRHEFDLYYSDDNGATWQKTTTFNFIGEAHILQLQSGKLLGAFRYQRYWIPSGVPGFTPDTQAYVTSLGGDYTQKNVLTEGPWGSCVLKNVFVGESFDNGVTWQNIHPLRDKNGSALVIYGEAHGDLVQVPDGRIVMVYDHRYTNPAYPSDVRQMIARVSCDEGNTWETEVFQITTGNGYPSSAALEDGTIVTITGDDLSSSSPYTSAVIRWRLPAKKTGTPKASLKVVRKYAIVGRDVLFDASDSNDTENNIVKYEWDFNGNNKFDYSETPSNHPDGAFDGKTIYEYTQAGEYTVRVRVTDSSGLNDTYNIYHMIVSEDSDGDDMPDGWETRNGLDPTNPNDALIDSDGDGYNNLSEYLHQSNPYNDQSPLLPTTIFVPSDIASYQQAAGLAINGDDIVVTSDMSHNGSVDWIDFATFAQQWMNTNCGNCGGADFTGDGNVDWEDLSWFAADWLAGKQTP